MDPVDLFVGDPLTRMRVHRLALSASDAGWADVDRLARHPATRQVAGQLYRALGSIGANLAEGYSRSSARDRARFYEYALGSARECSEWYARSRHLLGEPLVQERMRTLNEIVRIQLSVLRRARAMATCQDARFDH